MLSVDFVRKFNMNIVQNLEVYLSKYVNVVLDVICLVIRNCDI